MAPIVRQQATGFAAAGAFACSATFASACLPGSLIVWIVGGDKAVGTVTPPTDCPNFPINLQTVDVSLLLAFGTADGGETAISGTVTSNGAGHQVWVLEITDDASTGAWERKSTVTLNTAAGGAGVTGLSVGPAPAATGAGIGITAQAFDTAGTQGTVAWTAGWDSRRVTTDSASGAAGLWGAVKDVVAQGATETAALTRTGGSADQAHGLLVVFGRAASATPITGTAAGTAPRATGALVATQRTAAALAGSVPQVTGAVVAQVRNPAVMAGQAPRAAGNVPAIQTTPGAVAGSVPQVSAALVGVLVNPAALGGSAPRAVGALVGDLPGAALTGTVAGQAPRAAGQLAGTVPVLGELAGQAPRARGTLTDFVAVEFVTPLRAGTVGLSLGTGPRSGPGATINTGPGAGTSGAVGTGPRMGDTAVIET